MNYCPFNEIKDVNLEPISFYFKTFDYDFRMGMHHHPYFEIMYAYTGDFEVYVHYKTSTPSTKKVTVRQGQFIFFDAMTYHRLVIPDNKQRIIYNVEFDPRSTSEYDPCGVQNVMAIDYYSAIRRLHLEKLGGGTAGYTVLTDTARVEYALKTLITLHQEPIHTIDRALAAQFSVINLLSEISQCFQAGFSGALPYIKKTNEYISNHYTAKISLDDIAAYVGINKSYLQRQYKKYTGSTILSALNAIRVKRAAYFLKSTPYPVRKITEMVGFSSKQQIEYEFRRIMGMMPSDYRKKFESSIVDHHAEVYKSASTPFNLPVSSEK